MPELDQEIILKLGEVDERPILRALRIEVVSVYGTEKNFADTAHRKKGFEPELTYQKGQKILRPKPFERWVWKPESLTVRRNFREANSNESLSLAHS